MKRRAEHDELSLNKNILYIALHISVNNNNIVKSQLYLETIHFLQRHAEQGSSLSKVRSVNNVDHHKNIDNQLYLETIQFLPRHAEQGRRSPR